MGRVEWALLRAALPELVEGPNPLSSEPALQPNSAKKRKREEQKEPTKPEKKGKVCLRGLAIQRTPIPSPSIPKPAAYKWQKKVKKKRPEPVFFESREFYLAESERLKEIKAKKAK